MKWKNNLLRELKAGYVEILKDKYGLGESKQLLNLIIESFFGYTKVQMALDPTIRLSESEILKLHVSVKELMTNKPVQYITGKVLFHDLNILVNESVLIPRPETEELVNFIIQNETTKGLHVIDIGTGSGCIAISLSKYLKESHVTAIDISIEALELAEKNSHQNDARIDFKYIDILNHEDYNTLEKFDIVVSNPPYVTESDRMHMQKNVLDYEPHAALFVRDDDALKFYKAILEFCTTHIRNGGHIYFEINEHQAENVVQLCNDYGFHRSKIHTDFHGKNRFVTAVKNP